MVKLFDNYYYLYCCYCDISDTAVFILHISNVPFYCNKTMITTMSTLVYCITTRFRVNVSVDGGDKSFTKPKFVSNIKVYMYDKFIIVSRGWRTVVQG